MVTLIFRKESQKWFSVTDLKQSRIDFNQNDFGKKKEPLFPMHVHTIILDSHWNPSSKLLLASAPAKVWVMKNINNWTSKLYVFLNPAFVLGSLAIQLLVSMVFYLRKINENWNLKIKKKSWEPFRSCLLNSTANPAQFGWKWAELAVLVSW